MPSFPRLGNWTSGMLLCLRPPGMKAQLAIYDMDRTITRRATYTPFLVHAALRLAPWRLLLFPLVLLSMLAYVLKLLDRGKLKEINYRLLVGRGIAPERLEPVVESFAERQLATNIMPGAWGSTTSSPPRPASTRRGAWWRGSRAAIATARPSST
jgi:hypothetical protein